MHVLVRRIGALLLPLLLFACSFVDLHQAELCEAAAGILLSDDGIASLTTVTDRSVPHGVVTAVAMLDGRRHTVSCTFTSANAKSADFLALSDVAIDRSGALDAAALAALRGALERKGLATIVSWVPNFGGPHGELAPASPRVAVLYFLQLVVNGLTYGAMIGLVAVGYTLIYGVIGVVNLAFGDIYMIGAFIAIAILLLLKALGIGSFVLGLALTLPLAMLLTAGYNAATDRAVFQPLRRASPLMPLVASVGLSMVLQSYVFLTGGARDRWLAAPSSSGFVLAAADGFELYVNRPQLEVIVITVAVVALCWFALTRTRFGRAQRACAQDRRMAALLGLDVERIIAGTFAVGGGLAACSGLMAATYYGGVTVGMGVMMGLKALTAAIVGGLGNVMGALLGGFAVALLESFAAGYFYGGYKEAAVFALLILLLVFRPQGMLEEV